MREEMQKDEKEAYRKWNTKHGKQKSKKQKWEKSYLPQILNHKDRMGK